MFALLYLLKMRNSTLIQVSFTTSILVIPLMMKHISRERRQQGQIPSLNAIISNETMKNRKLMSSQYTKAMPFVKFQGLSINHLIHLSTCIYSLNNGKMRTSRKLRLQLLTQNSKIFLNIPSMAMVLKSKRQHRGNARRLEGHLRIMSKWSRNRIKL